MTPSTSPPTILLIGYGEHHGGTLSGPYIVDLVEALHFPNLRTYATPQLTPELSTKLAQADYAIFVNACKLSSPMEVRVTPLKPWGSETTGTSAPALGHSCDPQSLLALTQSAYGRHPRAWWIEIPLLEETSEKSAVSAMSQGIQQALEEIQGLSGKLGAGEKEG